MRLYIGSIDLETPAEELVEFLEKEIGPVENIYYARDKVSNRFRGFAFITFKNEGDGERAISELHNVIFNDKRLIVKEALPRPIR